MSDDDQAWPSLILAKHERAHREHVHQHQQHQHQHNLFHRAQTGATTTAVQSVVTEITATVSVVQQIDVDSNGSTFAIQTVLADSTQGSAATTDTNVYTTTSASPGVTTASSASSTIAGGSPQISSASQSLNSTSTASASTLSTSTPFSSLIASSNSTTLISSSSNSLSATPNFSNSSITSTSSLSSSSSFTYLTSSSSSSEESTSSTSSTSSLYSPSSSSPTAATGIGGGGIGGTTSSTPSSTAASGSGNGSSSSNTPTPVVVGGVVGGVAGAAIIIFLLLAFIRWKKRHQSMLSLGSGNEPSGAVTSRDVPPPSGPSGGMAERRSLFLPAALANFPAFNKRTSRQTDRTVSSTAESERGFYRVSGRKLPSVLQTGGDGYGGGITEGNTLSGSSFYRDSQGYYGGPGSPSTAGPAGASMRPESGVPVMRPSPARTPVTQQGPFSAVVTAPEPLTPPPRRPDALGRSHPSQDGSHTSSRFTEDV